jgi:hypothetical protein
VFFRLLRKLVNVGASPNPELTLIEPSHSTEYGQFYVVHCVANIGKRGRVCPSLVVRWMLSGHVRQILWRQEFNRNVLLSLHRPFVQESGLVTPQANGAHCSRKKGDRAAHELYIQHLAERSDGGADPYGF